MGIPKNFGISKISMLRGEEEGRYGGREASSSRQKNDAELEDLSFELNSANDAVALLQPPSFNVLYVSTPKIGILQTPEFQAVAQLWDETVELVKPLLRFGFPETSLKTKCPYYDDKLYASSSGVLLASDRTRTLMTAMHKGKITPWGQHSTGHAHQHNNSNDYSSSHGHSQLQQEQQEQASSTQQQPQAVQPGQSVGMFGISTLAFLASQVMGGLKQQHKPQQHHHQQQQQQEVVAAEALQFEEQHPERSIIPRSRLLVPDIPSGTLVLALNLGAYWAITKQARRSSMGGTMTG